MLDGPNPVKIQRDYYYRKERNEIDEGIKLLKKKMLDFGRGDFTNYLAELLHVSIATASSKLNGKSGFKQEEIVILTKSLGLNGEEVKAIFANGVE